MIKGIKDALPTEKARFTVSDDRDSDFYLDGFIDDYGRDPRVSHMKLRRDQVHLAVDGQLWSRDTGEKILSFQTSAVINLKTQDPKDAAYQMGAAIAHFIALQQVKENKS
jgi:hypothetical protein